MYAIRFKKSAEKELEKLPTQIIKRISRAIDALTENPQKIRRSKESLWRMRIGNYRVIYLVEDVIKIVEIRRVGHRKDIYE